MNTTKKLPSVDILLSTFNGETFLAALLDSLLVQDYHHWRLIWRDDGSSDNTLALMQAWQQAHPEKILNLESRGKHLGFVGSYNALVAESTADYILFCDQDDVWFPQKVSKLILRIQQLEKNSGKELPLLVHSDLIVTDEHLNVLHKSFWRYQYLNVHQTSRAYLMKNVVTACACIFNRAAAEVAFPAPKEACVHDHWLALVVAALGKISVCNEPLLYYRQHQSNTVGAFSKINLFRLSRWRQYIRRTRRTTLAKSQQGDALLRYFSAELCEEDKQRIQALKQLTVSSLFKRIQLVFKYQLGIGGMFNCIVLIAISASRECSEP